MNAMIKEAGWEVFNETFRGGGGGGHSEKKEEPKKEGVGSTLLLYPNDEYAMTYVMFTFLGFIILLEVFFEETTLHNLEKWIPKSIILILVGLMAGCVMYLCVGEDFLHHFFGGYVFFDYLLPPIILHATYDLYSREFFLQLDGIVLLAAVGTTINIFAISLSLYAVSNAGLFSGLGIIDCYIFGCIVAAVDPVAVLAVFDELGVQKALTMLVLGESLFNDGVTVVFFETFLVLENYELTPTTYVFIALSFFSVALGGMMMGVIIGCFSALLCKFTTKKTKMLEMPIVLGFAYMSYLNAHLFKWSGIMAIIGCGLAQRRYCFPNLFRKSHKVVESATLVIAHTADVIIFLLFGMNIYRLKDLDVSFMLWTILFCTIYRCLTVGILGSIVNIGREQHRLTFSHMFIMSYGGLRGAVSYVMAVFVYTDSGRMILSGTMAIILFTCFLQGGTVELWVKVFKFEEPEGHPTFLMIAVEKVAKHVMTGMSAILGGSGSRLLALIEVVDYYDKKYFQPVLCLKGADDEEELKELEEKRDATVMDLYKDPRLLGVLKYAQEQVQTRESKLSKMSKAERIQEMNKMKSFIKEELMFEDIDPEDKDLDWKHKVSYYNKMRAADKASKENDEDFFEVGKRTKS